MGVLFAADNGASSRNMFSGDYSFWFFIGRKTCNCPRLSAVAFMVQKWDRHKQSSSDVNVARNDDGDIAVGEVLFCHSGCQCSIV